MNFLAVSDASTVGGGAALLTIGLYLLPGVIASLRGHHNAGAIWATALLAGWTGIGWLIALIWSLTSARKQVVYQPPPPQIVINNNNSYQEPVHRPQISAIERLNVRPTQQQLTADEQRVLEQYRRQVRQLHDSDL